MERRNGKIDPWKEWGRYVWRSEFNCQGGYDLLVLSKCGNEPRLLSPNKENHQVDGFLIGSSHFLFPASRTSKNMGVLLRYPVKRAVLFCGGGSDRVYFEKTCSLLGPPVLTICPTYHLVGLETHSRALWTLKAASHQLRKGFTPQVDVWG